LNSTPRFASRAPRSRRSPHSPTRFARLS
jgi:hypothetical protein